MLPASGVHNINTKASLCHALGISEGKLNYLLYKLDDEERYYSFSIKKSSGGERKIDAPIKPLKEIQEQLAVYLKGKYKPKQGVYGYVPKRGIKENALVHFGARKLFRVDIKDFFPSIHIGRVIGVLKARPFRFDDKVATIIAQLCCKDGRLPQGAPTSPVLSNLVCRTLDKKLMDHAKRFKCKYSRYADDIFFSTYRSKLPSSICEINHEYDIFSISPSSSLAGIFESEGFDVNPSKTSLAGKSQRQVVAGIKINEKLNVDRSYVLELRAMIHAWEKHGLENAEKFFHKKYLKNHIGKPLFSQVVRSKVEHLGYIKGYDDPLYLKYSRKLSMLNPNFEFNKRKVAAHGGKLLKIYAEGPTDVLHIKKALKWFNSIGEYHELGIKFEELPGVSGADPLMKHAEAVSKESNSDFKVFLFDKDVKAVMKKISLGPGDTYKYFDNNVWAVLTPNPAHRKDDEFCIEMYYTSADLSRKDSSGRRLYLNAEFDEKNFHFTENAVCTWPKKNTLVVDDCVYDVNTKAKASLSKMEFAKNIYNEADGFYGVDFNGFRSLFDVLDEIHRKAFGR